MQCLCAGSAWSPGNALDDVALPAALPWAQAGTRTVRLGCACPLQLIQGINSGAGSRSMALWLCLGRCEQS